MIDFNEQFLFVLKEEENKVFVLDAAAVIGIKKKTGRKSIIIEKNISICCTNQIH